MDYDKYGIIHFEDPFCKVQTHITNLIIRPQTDGRYAIIFPQHTFYINQETMNKLNEKRKKYHIDNENIKLELQEIKNKVNDIFDFLIGQKRFEENKDSL